MNQVHTRGEGGDLGKKFFLLLVLIFVDSQLKMFYGIFSWQK